MHSKVTLCCCVLCEELAEGQILVEVQDVVQGAYGGRVVLHMGQFSGLYEPVGQTR